MKLTNKERNALTVFDWKIKGRTKHNWSSWKGSKSQFDLNAAQELQHILDSWNKTKQKLGIKLRSQI